MRYRIELKPNAEKDLRAMQQDDRKRVVERWRWLEDDLRGDVKTVEQPFP
jgi:mRNA-degrading endonuclease RelE of RelBE toxin-antitoxin system